MKKACWDTLRVWITKQARRAAGRYTAGRWRLANWLGHGLFERRLAERTQWLKTATEIMGEALRIVNQRGGGAPREGCSEAEPSWGFCESRRKIVYAETSYIARERERRELDEHYQRTLARELADKLLERGMIDYFSHTTPLLPGGEFVNIYLRASLEGIKPAARPEGAKNDARAV